MQGKDKEDDAVMMSFILKIIAGAALMLLTGVLAILFEGVDRVLHAKMQRRWGPPVLQPFYDILKLLGKENIVPRRANKWLYNTAPWFSVAIMLHTSGISSGHFRNWRWNDTYNLPTWSIWCLHGPRRFCERKSHSECRCPA